MAAISVLSIETCTSTLSHTLKVGVSHGHNHRDCDEVKLSVSGELHVRKKALEPREFLRIKAVPAQWARLQDSWTFIHAAAVEQMSTGQLRLHKQHYVQTDRPVPQSNSHPLVPVLEAELADAADGIHRLMVMIRLLIFFLLR